MKKDEILNASKKEHRNKDLAEMEVVYQAGSHASRVGALVCCLLSLLSSVLAHTMIYSPWVIFWQNCLFWVRIDYVINFHCKLIITERKTLSSL